MKILIISDLHLGKKFSPKKCEFIKNIVKKHQLLIINGDLWDDTKCSFNEFFESEWKILFPVFKSKKAIYIFGNHDMHHKSDNRIFKFCDKATHEYRLSLKNGENILISHGHRQSFLTRLAYRFFKDNIMLLHYLFFPFDVLHKILMQLAKRGIPVGKYFNWSYRRSQNNEKTIFIMGHTHAPDYSPKSNYINSGFIDDTFASYVVIDGNDISLVKKSY